jgi:hypothetical protein
MTKRSAPKTRLHVPEGTSVWEALAREVAQHPDSVVSLHAMSAVGNALRPRTQATEALTHALQAQLQEDGPMQQAAVQAAIVHYERTCGAPMDPQLLLDLRALAAQNLAIERRKPPAIDTILEQRPATTDTGYRMGIHLEGIEGTWHRLWAMLVLVISIGQDVDTDEGAHTVRAQLERLLGRSMTSKEWAALVARAQHHSATMAAPGSKAV